MQLRKSARIALLPLALLWPWAAGSRAAEPAQRPNIVLIIADDLGFSDLACYGSQVRTPRLDQLAQGGVRFAQFYNAGRCCPTRASVLTGLYPHQAGVGHMLEDWKPPGYTTGLNERCATIAELLGDAGYRCYHVGKWHVGGVGGERPGRNHPLNRGFHRAYGTGGGGNFFKPTPLYLDDQPLEPGENYYTTDAFTDYAVQFLAEHKREHADQPAFLHLCYTAPHFPLQAKPDDIARYKGAFNAGWDSLREQRFERQKQLGLLDSQSRLSPRDPVARAWKELSAAERAEQASRMEVHAAMIDCMDQGIGRVVEQLKKSGDFDNTLILFFSDNGASAESNDASPELHPGEKPAAAIGTAKSRRTLEIGWANAANTPFRENKMWMHEGGISTPLVVSWPAQVAGDDRISEQVGHVIDVMPTLLEAAGVSYPERFQDRQLTPLSGESLLPALKGEGESTRALNWEHEGNRAIRLGEAKLVAAFGKPWELYNLKDDRTETRDLVREQPQLAAMLAEAWQRWADHVGVVPWEELPGAKYRPSPRYRKKSEPIAVDQAVNSKTR